MSAPIPSDIIEAAKAAQAKWSIPASISIAQWAVESGRGQHMPVGSNNPFGIKSVAGQPSVTVRTREVDHAGHDYYINAAFRKFATIAEAFDEHGRLLATSGHYAHARTLLPDADAFADALTGVYATDPHYGATLKGVMKGGNLYQYDETGEVPAVSQAPSRPTLRIGATGPDVRYLQGKLGVPQDGIFGPATLAVVKTFQAQNGLVADGVVGPSTWSHLL